MLFMLSDDWSAGKTHLPPCEARVILHYRSDPALQTVMKWNDNSTATFQQRRLCGGEIQPPVLVTEPLGFKGGDFVPP